MAAARRGGDRPGSHARQSWPVAVLLLSAVGGFVFAAGAVTSRGSDLRPAGGDISTLLQDRARRVEVKRVEAQKLRREVDDLSSTVVGEGLAQLLATARKLQDLTGLSAAEGPGVRVTLTDAPRSSDREGLDPNLLVVHQQDIQAFVNALWAGGAEAVSLQGQRLISTTGIKCVGSTVVLDGVPYSPPYVIEAVGNVGELSAGLTSSPEVTTYQDYARRYQLGLLIESEPSLRLEPYGGAVSLRHASAVD